MAQNMVLLDRVELNASAASVSLSNIPQTGYTDLMLVISARGDAADTRIAPWITFNGSSSGYSDRVLYGQDSNTVGGYSNDASGAKLGGVRRPAANATANTFGSIQVYIPNYTGSAYKSVSIESSTENNSSSAWVDEITSGLWSNSAAITSITFTASSGNFVVGSTFSLYGIAAYGTTPTVAPKADGGNVIATDGTYWYHAFLSSGTFTPQTSLTCDYLVVAGGGGAYRGGGGAGGVVYATSASFAGSTGYAAVIGAGGNLAAGGNSTFNGLTANGGALGTGEGGAGNNGGSGSGASAPGSNAGGSATQTSGSGYTGYGNAGGASSGSSYNAAGGGGAGAAGSATSGSNGGAGGAGLNTWSAWLSATALGVSGYIAGGGGGFGYTGTAGAGGSGGGVAGTTNGVNNTTNAPANTGSAGGGGNSYSSGSTSLGGSGLVIIRYLVA